MIPFDKFGRPIYAKPYAILVRWGDILVQNGYKESGKKPNLFYKPFSCGILFADMRGTDIVPIYEDPVPMVYIQHKGCDSIPFWKRHRIIGEELRKITEAGCEYRFSMEAQMHGDCICGRSFTSETGFCAQNAGYCNWCKKDFQDEGEYCSQKCRGEHVESLKEKCVACGKSIDFTEVHRHHISYFPEQTVPTHMKCHLEIHKTDKYPGLRPQQDEIDRFYKKGKYAEPAKPKRKTKKQIREELVEEILKTVRIPIDDVNPYGVIQYPHHDINHQIIASTLKKCKVCDIRLDWDKPCDNCKNAILEAQSDYVEWEWEAKLKERAEKIADGKMKNTSR